MGGQKPMREAPLVSEERSTVFRIVVWVSRFGVLVIRREGDSVKKGRAVVIEVKTASVSEKDKQWQITSKQNPL